MTDGASKDKGMPFDISERGQAQDALRQYAERQAMLLEVTSDLIRASGPGELGRMTFERVSSAFCADICFNYRLDPVDKRLKLVFGRGIPQEQLEAAQWLELGQAFCGTAAGGCEAVVADKQRIARDPKGAFVRDLRATAYACHPLMASDGHPIGTFSVASTTREGFTDDEVAWLGTVTNFLAQAWERLDAEKDLRVSEERLRLSLEAAGLGHWDFDFASGTPVWSDQTRKLLGVEPGTPASRALLLSLVHTEDRPRFEEHMGRSSRPDSDEGRRLEFRIVMQDGAIRWLEDQNRVERDMAGTPLRAVGLVRDITARKNAEEAQARLAAIVTSSADAIMSKTLGSMVTSWNEAAERMYGYSASEMIGQSIRRLVPADRQHEEDMILVRLARNESIENFETVGLAKDGGTFDASATISPMRDSEGRVIGAAKIVRDITERKQAEQSLRATKDRLQFALDAAQLGWWQYDPLHRVFLWDTRSKEMLGLADHKTDIEEFMKHVHPDDVKSLWVAIEEAVDPADPKPRATEFRLRPRDGEVRWVQALGLVHLEGSPPERRTVSMVGTAQDITERKRREEERREQQEREHLLMREVNHRARNMLSLVQAIARQTAARDFEDFMDRFAERVQALAASQDLLIRNEWRGVDIRDLVRGQLAHFADLIDSRIAVYGRKLRLKATSAQAVGLALHELATNAGKYGALSTDTGRVDVCWESDRYTFAMTWTEHHGPPVSVPKQRGFGTRVMEEMTERSLGGTVDLCYAPSGVTWRLTCPAANALEPGEWSSSFD
jgi:PAS domain S-box-containing protein